MNSDKPPNEQSKRLERKQKQYWDSADWVLEMNKGNAYGGAVHKASMATPPQELHIVESEVHEDQSYLQQRHLKGKLAHNPERKYFDSADWALTGETNAIHSYRSHDKSNASSILTKKQMARSRQYFDSADWAMNNSIPCIQPKLPVLKT